MSNELQLVADGDGLAVIGDLSAVEQFLTSNSFASRELELPRLSTVLSTGAGIADAASIISASAGRWVQLTAESAEKMKALEFMKGSSSSSVRTIFMKNGDIAGAAEILKPGLTMLANPAVLAGVGGLMAQLAMKQAMDEITEYLAVIDAKVDDILRAQKDAVLADMIGVGLVVDEAMTIRADVGRVSEVTWSKVQGSAFTIARTQAYALRQLDALAEKMEKHRDITELRGVFDEADASVREWLAVIARSVQLQDAVSILELDRVLAGSPDDIEGHRVGVRNARQKRVELISRSTAQLMARMDASAVRADSRVLYNPIDSPAVVRSSNRLGSEVGDFHELIGIERGSGERTGTRWRDAAIDKRDEVIELGAEGADAAWRFGKKLGDEIGKRLPRPKN